MNNPDDFLPLKPDIFEILLALESGPRHGYGIVAAVEHRTESQRRLLPSLLYRRLARLVEEGIVEEVPMAHDDDTRKKHYQLTPLGRGIVRLEAARIVELGRNLERYRWSES